jgi:hypothetical protein
VEYPSQGRDVFATICNTITTLTNRDPHAEPHMATIDVTESLMNLVNATLMFVNDFLNTLFNLLAAFFNGINIAGMS